MERAKHSLLGPSRTSFGVNGVAVGLVFETPAQQRSSRGLTALDLSHPSENSGVSTELSLHVLRSAERAHHDHMTPFTRLHINDPLRKSPPQFHPPRRLRPIFAAIRSAWAAAWHCNMSRSRK